MSEASEGPPSSSAVDSLLAGKIYFALYTRQKPLGAARAWILNAAER